MKLRKIRALARVESFWDKVTKEFMLVIGMNGKPRCKRKCNFYGKLDFVLILGKFPYFCVQYFRKL